MNTNISDLQGEDKLAAALTVGVLNDIRSARVSTLVAFRALASAVATLAKDCGDRYDGASTTKDNVSIFVILLLNMSLGGSQTISTAPPPAGKAGA